MIDKASGAHAAEGSTKSESTALRTAKESSLATLLSSWNRSGACLATLPKLCSEPFSKSSSCWPVPVCQEPSRRTWLKALTNHCSREVSS